VVPRHAEQTALDRLLAAIDGRDAQALAAVLDVAAAAGGGVFGIDEQAVEAAGIGQRVERGIAGPIEEGAVGVKQIVEPIDENADRQPFQDRPAFVSIARGVAIAGRLWRFGWRRGDEWLLDAIGVAGFRRRFLEPLAQLAGKLL